MLNTVWNRLARIVVFSHPLDNGVIHTLMEQCQVLEDTIEDSVECAKAKQSLIYGIFNQLVLEYNSNDNT